MTRFDGLIRLRKWELDGERRKLADLEGQRDEIQDRIRTLQSDLISEQEIASRTEEAAMTYGGFAQAVISRRNDLHDSLAKAQEEVEKQHEVVCSAFEELKRYEIAAENARRNARKERERAEEIEANELALQQHRRKQQS